MRYNIAVAGTGYVGLSIATLLAQHNHVTAVDIIPEMLEKKARIFADLLKQGAIKEDIPTLYMGMKEAEAVKLHQHHWLYQTFGGDIRTVVGTCHSWRQSQRQDKIRNYAIRKCIGV